MRTSATDATEDAGRSRWHRWTVLLFGAVAVLALAAGTVSVLNDRLLDPAEGDHPPKQEEEATPQDRAEVFAVRALAAAGLYGPRGLLYSLATEEVEQRGPHSWRLGFGAYRCGTFRDNRGARYETCKPLSGEDASGSARTDSWLVVTLREGRWQVSAVQGNFTERGRQELQEFSLRDQIEPPHWEFPRVVLRPAPGAPGTMIEASQVWVGPIPYNGSGSICTMLALADGRVVYEGEPMYVGAPDERWQRAGGAWGEQFRGHAEDGRVDCDPFEGAGWQPERIDLEVVSPSAVRVSAPLRYHGEPVMNPEGECRAVLYAADDKVLGTGFQQIRGVDLLRHPEQRRYNLSFRVETATPDAALRADVTCRMA